jgi:hypothetical protein
MEPGQSQDRLSRFGICSKAAARVTVLYTEPGVNTEERKRFKYAPFQRSLSSKSPGTFNGS